MNKLPYCQLLNDKVKSGLFIKQTNLSLCGWKGTAKDGEEYTHTYNNEAQESGLFFKSCSMHVLQRSPRLVEITKKGQDNGVGKAGTIVGNYEFPEGNSLYQQLGVNASLRSFYLLYLVNPSTKKNLHKVPLVLSVHGVAAVEFGTALENFYRLVEATGSELNGDENTYITLNEQARCLTIFTPTFKASLEPKQAEKKSWCCVIENFKQPTTKDLEKFFATEKSEAFWQLQEDNKNFASRYASQLSETVGVHEVKSGVNIDQFNSSDNFLPSSDTNPEDVEKLYQLVKNANLKQLQKDMKI